MMALHANVMYRTVCLMGLLSMTSLLRVSGTRMLRGESDDYEKWVAEQRSKYPCKRYEANLPFVQQDRSAVAAMDEDCNTLIASQQPSPPPPYTGWEAYWMERLGRPTVFPEHWPNAFPLYTETAPLAPSDPLIEAAASQVQPVAETQPVTFAQP